MAKAINDDICIQGSTLVLGITFPPIDGIDNYSLEGLIALDAITVKYYIANTNDKYTAVLFSVDDTDKNTRAFTVSNTDSLIPGVLMIETIINVPEHDKIPARTEIARCSSGIAIVK